MIKNFIFLGAPGVGKGTLATLLQEKKGIKHISTGDIFRNEIQNKTKLGLKIKKILSSGKFVSDELTNEIVEKVLSSNEVIKKGFILDGYPRTVNQAKFLESIGIDLTNVILFKASDEIIMNRLLKRGREDDNLETISTRLEIYGKKTKPLIDFYRLKQKLIIVDAQSNIDINFRSLLKAVY